MTNKLKFDFVSWNRSGRSGPDWDKINVVMRAIGNAGITCIDDSVTNVIAVHSAESNLTLGEWNKIWECSCDWDFIEEFSKNFSKAACYEGREYDLKRYIVEAALDGK